ARLHVEDLRTRGHAHLRVRAFTARTVRAFAVAAALRVVLRVVAQVQERVERIVCDQPHVAAAPALAARRSAARHEFLAPKGRHAVAAVPAPHTYSDAIKKHSRRKSLLVISYLFFVFGRPSGRLEL